MDFSLFGLALGIKSPWFVEKIEFSEQDKRLDIHINFTRGSKFEVDGALCPVHDTEQKTWRHLNFFQHECYLHARTPRVKTEDGRVLMVLPPWAGKMYGFTLLFEALIVELCRHMPVTQVAKMPKKPKIDVHDGKIWRMLDLYVNAARFNENYKDVSVVGMDETKVRREEAKTNPLLAKSRYVFLKNEENLTEKQRLKKEELEISGLNLQSMEALRMRETFQQLYNVWTTGQFVIGLKKWVKWVVSYGLPAMEKVAITIIRHWDGIVRWKQSQINNGILEGLNWLRRPSGLSSKPPNVKLVATKHNNWLRRPTGQNNRIPANWKTKPLNHKPTHYPPVLEKSQKSFGFLSCLY